MKSFSRSSLLIAAMLSVAIPVQAQNPEGDWPVYRGNVEGTGYSALGQITAANVGQLAQAWIYSLAAVSDDDTRRSISQATAIKIADTLYVPAADRVVALDPVSGAQKWVHELAEGAPSRRGVTYWPGTADSGPRILFSSGQHLHALDAATGAPVAAFGEAGRVDLGIPYNSVPLIFNDIIIVGANTPRGSSGGIGNPRAYDAATGAKLWEFSAVAQPGNPDNASWAGQSWEGRLGVNAWPFYFTVDTERDLLYLPLASPLPFAYGGDRAGANLYANAIVAVDINTGDYVWDYQTIHHDLWDHDPPAPPTLFDIESAGESIPALAVTTKSGYLFLLNRETGEPLYDIEERPVPSSEVPGERNFPTQPIPVNPPPMARVSYSLDDLVTATDTTAAHVAACSALLGEMGQVVNRGPYTPWSLRSTVSGPRTTLLFPGLGGGPNWGGVAYDPNRSLAYVFAADIGTFGWLEATAPGAELPYQLRTPRPSGFEVVIDGVRWPCQKPPWGRLSAVDTRTGELLWQRPVGVTEGLPAERQNTGRPGRAGAIVTGSGLLFLAATDDNRLRALDAATGEELWQARLPGQGNANPMTYLGADGRQYITIAVPDALIGFALP